MDSAFNTIKSTFTLFDKITTDNRIFRLHCQFTVIALIVCAFLVSTQYIGNPITCTAGDGFDDNHNDLLNTYCWISSTYTIPSLLVKDGSGAHPGVGPSQQSEPYITRTQHNNKNNTLIIHHGHDDKKQYHTYYQWVIFVLLFQALLFYIPKLIWSTWENGRLSMLIMDLSTFDFKLHEKSELEWQNKIALKYFVKSLNQNNNYFYYFVLCELLNLLNVILQIIFTNIFLGYEFTTYGLQVLDFIDQRPLERNDPMNLIFPKVTKCTFNMYGPSGNIVNHDSLCILQLNIYNEKIYIFLWFWFVILSIISILGLIYRLLTIFVLPFRIILLKKQSFTCSFYDIKDITHKLSVGDWFFLYQLSRNMNPIPYKEFIKDLVVSTKL